MKNYKKIERNIYGFSLWTKILFDLKGDFSMKKIKNVLVAILLIAIMSMTSVTAFAEEGGIEPRLSHTDSGTFSFVALNNKGYIDVTYYGYDSFVRADLNVKVQKRFLLVFWNDIYEWNASSIEIDGDFYHEFDIEKSGMYMANFTLTVTGSDGTVDTVTSSIQCKN